MTIRSIVSIPSNPGSRLCPVIFLLVLLAPGLLLADEASDQAELHFRRQARRSASLTLHKAKSRLSSPAQFSLLVIPVDFSDARLPADWDPNDQLSSQLFGPDDQTLVNYFRVASNQNLELDITMAPLVDLTGRRADYSDIRAKFFGGTRALATEAISSVARQGLEFRRLDNDGPDGMPGTADDDGQVDGILILHSGPGQENDPVNGLIQALQFFIDPAVESGGVQAAFYAVASLHSGLGIWAHETGHLLGMEDRYDPLLIPDAGGGDVRSLGGLGRFSLMSSGAFGIGDGQNPALPDAYTCLQLGWVDALRLPSHTGSPFELKPWREGVPSVTVWSNGPLESEFFVLETRDPAATVPFDVGLPRGQMLVYHVDENVPDGSYIIDDSGKHHLRARLIEADNDQGLEQGTDDGRDEDSFPGPLGVQSLTPLTLPGSGGYGGPSNVSLEEITSFGNFLTMEISDSLDDQVLGLEFAVPPAPADELLIIARSLGQSIATLTCTLEIQGDGGGGFPGGTQTVDFQLANSDGIWTPINPVLFVGPNNPEAGATTIFAFRFFADGVELPLENRPWVWLNDSSAFEFNNPAWIFWEQDFSGGATNTRWHLWDQAPFLTADASAILACTDEIHSNSEDWPNVLYGNGSRTAIISPPLGEKIRSIQLTHAIEVEYLHAGIVMDGAAAFWQGATGILLPAEPLDGWNAQISVQSNNGLNGAGVFADSLLVFADNQYPQWRIDVLSLPVVPGGPWRLRLEFASNSLWRRRGWFIAKMVPMEGYPAPAFPVVWNPSAGECPAGLSFGLPFPPVDFSNPVVEYYDENHGSFAEILHQDGRIATCSTGFVLPRDFVLDSLRPSGLTRHLLRVVVQGPQGDVASRAVVVYPDRGAQPVVYLEQPYPNPSLGGVKFLMDIPSGGPAKLRIYDLRGRRVFSQDYSSGRHQVFWSGSDTDGRRLPAGTYYLKLEGSGFSSLRKVVLVR